MTPTINGVYVDENPIPSIFVFDFEDHLPVAVSRNVSNRHSKYEGKLFSVWTTNPENYTPNDEGPSVVKPTTVDEIPDKLEFDEMYVQQSGHNPPTDEMLEEIEAYLQ